MDWLTEPWQFEFMQRALVAGAFVAIAGAVVGAFVVVKGLAFLSDAVAHSSLAGAAVAFLGGGGSTAISIGAVIAAVLTALGVSFLTRASRLREDTAIALLFAGLFGFAILLISRARNYALELNSFIVGNILGVSNADLILMGVLTAMILVATLYFYKELLFTAYDPTMAAASGVPVAAVQAGLLVLVALAAVIAFRLVGVVLVMAMLVAPASTAGLLVRRIPLIMVTATATGLLSTVAGLYLSFYGDFAAGPSVVMVAIAAFALAFVVSPRGLSLASAVRGRPGG
jgi:ABC-type Mn2+/Zn2+ transport system permease subunit